MAQRRMFSLKIIDTDAFLDMPVSGRELYFQLAMRADDDGFISNPKRIIKMIGSSDDDMKVLLAKQFIIPFESGVCVVKHWKIHNYIQKDRYQETECVEEKRQLKEVNDKYELEDGIQNVYRLDTQVRLGKVRLGKDNKVADKSAEKTNIQHLVDYFFELKGWDHKEQPIVVYNRFTRPAKELIGLCENDIEEAKHCIKKVADWASSRELDWSIETVFKKWYDIDKLKPKDKKPYYNGNRIFEMSGKKYVLMDNGDKMEFAGNLNEIIYK